MAQAKRAASRRRAKSLELAGSARLLLRRSLARLGGRLRDGPLLQAEGRIDRHLHPELGPVRARELALHVADGLETRPADQRAQGTRLRLGSGVGRLLALVHRLLGSTRHA